MASSRDAAAIHSLLSKGSSDTTSTLAHNMEDVVKKMRALDEEKERLRLKLGTTSRLTSPPHPHHHSSSSSSSSLHHHNHHNPLLIHRDHERHGGIATQYISSRDFSSHQADQPSRRFTSDSSPAGVSLGQAYSRMLAEENNTLKSQLRAAWEREERAKEQAAKMRVMNGSPGVVGGLLDAQAPLLQKAGGAFPLVGGREGRIVELEGRLRVLEEALRRAESERDEAKRSCMKGSAERSPPPPQPSGGEGGGGGDMVLHNKELASVKGELAAAKSRIEGMQAKIDRQAEEMRCKAAEYETAVLERDHASRIQQKKIDELIREAEESSILLENQLIKSRMEHSSEATRSETAHEDLLDTHKRLQGALRQSEQAQARISDLEKSLQGKEAQRASIEAALRREEGSRGEVERAAMIVQAEAEELRGEVRGAEERVKRMRDAVSGAEGEVAMSVAHLEGGLRRCEAVLGVLATQVRNVAAGRQHAEAEREHARRGFGETLKAHGAEVNALRRDIRLREEEKASLMTTVRSLEGAVERGVEARAELEETIKGMEEEQRSLREAILSQKAEVLDVSSRISECEAARDDYRERLEVARNEYDDLAQATALSKETLEVELNEAHRRVTANEMRYREELAEARKVGADAEAQAGMEVFSLKTKLEAAEVEIAELREDRRELVERFEEADSRARAARQREDAARRDLDSEMEDYSKETASLRNKVDALQEALSAAETSKAERAERDHAAMCEAKEELAKSHVSATELQARLSEAIQRGNRLQISLESIDGDAARTWREKEAELKRLQFAAEEEVDSGRARIRELERLQVMGNAQIERLEEGLAAKEEEMADLRKELDDAHAALDAALLDGSSKERSAGAEGFTKGVEACQGEIAALKIHVEQAHHEESLLRQQLQRMEAELSKARFSEADTRREADDLVMQLAMQRAAKAQGDEEENARKSRENSPVSGGSMSPVERASSPGVGIVVHSPTAREHGEGEHGQGVEGGVVGSAANTPNSARVARRWALDPQGIPPGQTFV